MSEIRQIADIHNVIKSILKIRTQVPSVRSVLVAISGIDGCGKGYLTAKIVDQIKALGINAVSINGDGWLNLPDKRFNPDNPAEHFYLYAFRFKEMFSQLVLPLRDCRSISIEANFVEETATNYRKQLYEFENVDVIVLEAIYLLQPAFMTHYDLSFWIDCTFKTALERSLVRGQEGLSIKETIQAYRSIYFPAQVIHFQRDNPTSLATGIINNDPHMIEPKEYPSLLEIKQFKG
jgi:uridine kinase